MKFGIALIAAAVLLAPTANADDNDVDYISYLEQHSLGCGEGALKCSSDIDLIKLGHAVCYNIDHNGNTVYQAADELLGSAAGWINKQQSYVLVSAAVVSYCPWDKI